MELTLIDFRCHVQSAAWFPAQALTLIQGESGSGKSTFLAALRWALYGKVHNYAPTDKPKAKTQVVIRFWPHATGPAPPETPPTLEIFRQGKPSLIEVTTNGVTYAGSEAEAEIVRSFGTLPMYLATSCLEQGERAHLLGLPQSERLELLNHLSYLGDDPGRVIDIVRAALTADKADLASRQAVQDQERKRLLQLEAKFAMTAMMVADLQALDAEIQLHQTAVRDTEKALRTLQAARTTWRERQAQRAQRQRQLDTFLAEQGRLVALSELEKDLQVLQQELATAETATVVDAQLRERDRLKAALAAMGGKEMLTGPLPTTAAIAAAQAQEAARAQHLATATKLGLAYDEEAIAAQRELIQEQLDLQPLLQAYDQFQAAPAAGPDQDVPAAEAKLAEAKHKYNQLHEARDVQGCPCVTDCPHSVRVQAGRVVSSKVAPPTEADLAAARLAADKALQHLQHAKTQVQLQAQRDRLQKTYETLRSVHPDASLGAVRLTAAQQQGLQRRLGLLDGIKIITEPTTTAARLGQQREAHQLAERLATVEASLPAGAGYSSGTAPTELRKRQAALLRQRDRHVELEAQITAYQKQLATPTEAEPGPDTDLQAQLQTAQTKLRASQDRKAQQAHITELLRFRADVEQRDMDIKTLAERIAHLTSIHAKARALAQELLDTMLVALNDSLADIVSRLFDDPIEVQLRLQRQLKSKDASRPEVGLTIRYRNGEYNDLRQLSGGEADRVSLAVLLALSQRSTVPVLLLDEVTAALNEEYRERVFAVVRDFSAGKAVICIGHEEVAGHFEHLLDLTVAA